MEERLLRKQNYDLAVTAFSSVIPNHRVVRNLAFLRKRDCFASETTTSQ